MESIPWVAAQGLNTVFSVHLAPTFEETAAMLKRYQAELALHASDLHRLNGHVAQPRYGFSMHVYVADTDDRAREEARPAYAAFSHNYHYRMIRRGQPDRYQRRPTLDTQLEAGRVLVGSPQTVAAQLRSCLEQSGANYFVGCFSFGSLPLPQLLRSIELFAQEVVPAVTPIAR
jgi:alkanesulfonate monooxygenase SsuD/methylene tetrahydromethanopterin reductase-like flavin-dependent oxidoreductase (luciferase family)